MCGDLQHFTIILYILCYEIVVINSRTSTLWKLNPEKNKIIEASPFYQIASHSSVSNRAQFITEDDPLFNIITSTELLGQAWTKQSVQYYCTNCHNAKSISINASTNNSDPNVAINSNSGTKHDDEPLDCGKPVNFTYYDNLVGVVNRNRHPNVPEPQAALSFSKKSQKGKYTGKSELDIDALERRLKKAKKEKPKSVQLYNQIGNFWRIKGNAEKAIECFRRALAVAPHNAEVLLNLARVLFALQYLDDAIYLTRRSLEVQSPDKSAWHQYFTLGEIFKAYGHYQEASIHLRHTLELNPGYVPALLALREMESMPTATIHIYTLVIIICLVLGVLLVILSSVDNIVDYSEAKPQRHFNKAMAMRSLRGFGMSQKRCKKIAG